MPDIPTGYCTVDFHWAVSGDAEGAHCIVSFLAGQPTAVPQLQNLAAAFGDAWNGMGSADCTLVDGVAYFGVTGSGPVPIPFVVVPAIPGVQGAAVPINTCLLVRKVTASGGRKHRGRMFLPGVPEAHVAANGVMATASQGQSTSDWATFIASLGVSPGLTAWEDMVILHEDGSIPTIVTSLATQSKVATQRRRMR